MELTESQVLRIATLARLAVCPNQLPAIGQKLGAILTLIDVMQATDTSGIEPLAHPTAFAQPIELRLRDDLPTEPGDEASRAHHMASAPAQQDALFLVPRVLE